MCHFSGRVEYCLVKIEIGRKHDHVTLGEKHNRKRSQLSKVKNSDSIVAKTRSKLKGLGFA
jgi:hypothetical protein